MNLQEIAARGPLVVFFYPRDFTSICTQEACGFRDVHGELAEVGATVFGVSIDDAPTHRRFRAEHGLPYSLLSDPDHALAKAFDVDRAFGLPSKRATFVIDSTGKVVAAFQHELSAKRHVEDVRAALASAK